jgi:hypothetical protein
LVVKVIRNNGVTSSLAAQQYQALLRAILELMKKVHHVRLKRTKREDQKKIILGFMQYG